ncbi:MAG: hypothetical protein E7543_06695 [Ruminococcaceae bacterium]|nr:hypothetical protein [Oscillospiraceae bacterium]
MELKRINNIARDWRSVTEKVIQFEKPDLDKLKGLFQETYELIEEYSRAGSVPKGVCEVLLELHKFGWWVGDLDDTPIHYLYREIIDIMYDLEKYFLTRDADIETVKETIEKISS